ncbi:MAG: hypothetical protein WC365_00990 [Candidatus Babeliales bacterium]|jgi:hypothetical protein
MRELIKTYSGTIILNGNEAHITAKLYKNIEGYYDGMENHHTVEGLKEWDGNSVLDFNIATAIMGKPIETEIGAIIVTDCASDTNEFNFVGTGKPKFM